MRFHNARAVGFSLRPYLASGFVRNDDVATTTLNIQIDYFYKQRMNCQVINKHTIFMAYG